MRSTLMCLLLLISFKGYGATFYGKSFSDKSGMTIEDAIKSFSKNSEKDILIKGEVLKVCEKKGCWMTIQSKSSPVRVTFKDYGFFVPSSLTNKLVFLKGRLFEKIETVDLQKHYLEDQGASATEIAKVKKDRKLYHFVASGVQQI